MKKFALLLIIISNVSFGQKPLDVYDIARKGTLAQAKEILKSNPNAFNVINDEGYSPLILACYRSNNEVAKLLIAAGSDVNGISKMGTPLMAAVVKGNNEIAKILIENNAAVNTFDNNGTTALIYAVQFNNKTLLKLLLDKKADKTHRDNDGKTAFEHAVFSGHEEIINLLK